MMTQRRFPAQRLRALAAAAGDRAAGWYAGAPAWLRSRYATCLLALGLSVLGIAAQYLVTVNAFLRTGTLGWLIARATDDVRVELDGASMFWPGQIRFRKLELDIHDSAVHFRLNVSDGELAVDLWQLFQRRFSGRDLVARDMKLQLRTLADGVNRERLAALPPLTPPRAPGAPVPPDELWGVSLSNLNVEARELWINELRLSGPVQVQGGFALRPMRDLSIDSSRVSGRSVELNFGEKQQLARFDRIELRGQSQRADVSHRAARNVLSVADLGLSLAGRVRGLRPLRAYSEELELSGGAGTLSADLRVKSLELQSPGSLHYRTPALSVTTSGVKATGELDGMLALPEGSKSAVSTLLVRRLSVAREVQLGRVAEGRLRLRSGRALLDPQLERADARVRGLECPDISAFRHLVPITRLMNGRLQASASASYAEQTLDASWNATLRGGRFANDKAELGFDAWLSGSLDAKAPFRTAELSALNLDLQNVELASSGQSTRGFSVDLRATNLKLDTRRPALSGPVKLGVSNVRPFEVAAGASPPPLVHALLGLDDVELLVMTALDRSKQDLRIVEGESGSSAVSGRLLRAENKTYLALLVDNGPLSVGFGVEAGESTVHPFAGQGWLAKRLRRMPRD